VSQVKHRQLTPNQEAFVLGLVSGKSQIDAYKEAYPASLNCAIKSLHTKAWMLTKLPHVKARYDELQKRATAATDKAIKKAVAAVQNTAVDKAVMSAIDVLHEASCIASSNIADYLKVEYCDVVVGYYRDADGQEDKSRPITRRKSVVSIYDTAEISREKLAAVASMRQSKYGIEIKLHDKVKAIELLGKHHKCFDDNVKVEHTGEVKVIFNIPRPQPGTVLLEEEVDSSLCIDVEGEDVTDEQRPASPPE